MAVSDKQRTAAQAEHDRAQQAMTGVVLRADMPTIHEAFVATMREIGPIAKDRDNTHQHYKFRGIDDVLNAVHGALTNNGLFYLPNVIERVIEWRKSAEGKDMVHVFLTVRYDFYSESGEGPLSMTIPAEGRDSSDKGSNKAMSGALKYGLIQCFAIPVAGQDDADTTTPESHGPAAAEAPEPTPEAQPVPLDKRPKGVVPLLWTKQVAGSLTAALDPAGDMALEWWKDAMILNDLMAPDDEPDTVERITDTDATAVVEVLVAHLDDHKAGKEADDDAKADDRSEQEAIDAQADGYGSGY